MSQNSYRVYCLAESGRIVTCEHLTADTDEVAFARARQLKRDVPVCEVWRGRDGLIATFRDQGDQFG